MSGTKPPTPLELYCPTCGTLTPRAAWRCALRWLRSAEGRAEVVQVFRHKPCNELAYVVLAAAGARGVRDDEAGRRAVIVEA